MQRIPDESLKQFPMIQSPRISTAHSQQSEITLQYIGYSSRINNTLGTQKLVSAYQRAIKKSQLTKNVIGDSVTSKEGFL